MSRERIVSIVISISAIVGSTVAHASVYFADPLLKAAVEEALWISDPTADDMLGLVSLTSPYTGPEGLGITSLSGLEHAVNLQTLNLRGHQISSISALSDLANLETVILDRNCITDISALAGKDNLRKLDLERNEISNISVLSGRKNLRWLNLHRNRVRDLYPLTKLTSLTFLDLRINPLNEEAHEVEIPLIKANNPGIYFVHDPAYYRRLQLDSTQGGAITDPGEGDFLYEFDDFVWVTAEADPGYEFVAFHGNNFTTQNPTQLSMQQDYRMTAHFQSVLETIYVDDDGPNDPGPSDVYVSDPEEDGTEAHPFDRIQKAIDVAAAGATVAVRPGRYTETITIEDKSIRVTAVGPNSPDEDAYAIIHGQDRSPVVSFIDVDDPNCSLTRFVITGGWGKETAALRCLNSSPTVTNCLIVGNRIADDEGAAIRCENSAATLVNCTVADNDCGGQGAGLCIVDSNVVVVNSIFWNNQQAALLASGTSAPTVQYSDIEGGWPGLGNINAAPLFAQDGYWAREGDPTVMLDPSDAGAVWIAGDYHLQSEAGRWDATALIWTQDKATSPCIDAGNPASPIGRESDAKDSIINMGVYGGSAEASLSR